VTRVDEIVHAIEKLSLDERAELSRRLHAWIDDEWDQQIAEDARSGKLDDLLQKARQNVKDNRLMDLP
jgi:hypothetical protein